MADKGYHKAQTLADCEACNTRTYIPELRHAQGAGAASRRRSPGGRQAVKANRRRIQGAKSKWLQKRRSEVVERSFAHVCETGEQRGGRGFAAWRRWPSGTRCRQRPTTWRC